MNNAFEFYLLTLLQSILSIFSFRTVQRIGRIFGSIVFYCIPVRKKLVFENLNHAFPEKTREEIKTIALENFRSTFMTFFETFWIKRITEEEVRSLVRIPGTGKIDDLLRRGKGLIMLSGHISNWELIALSIGLISGHPLHAIIKKQHNPYVDSMMNRLRTKFNNTVVDMDRAPREIIKCLRGNGTVAILADQSGPEEGVFANFFGRPASTHVGPAVFCLRTGAPILMTYAVRRKDGTFDVEFEEVPTGDLQGTDEDKIRIITERHVEMLEKFVRRHPSQWLWMHKRWKHTEKYLQRRAGQTVL